MAGNANAEEMLVEAIHDVKRTITNNRDRWIASVRVGDAVKITTSGFFAFGKVVAIKKKHFKIESSDTHQYWVHGKRLRRGDGFSY